MELPQGIEKVFPLKSEGAHMLSVDPDAVAQPITVGEEKGFPRDSSDKHLISEDEMCEIEEKPKLSKRKLKKSSRMTVEEVKQKVCVNSNFKASSNVIFVQRHLNFKRKSSQDRRGIRKSTWKLLDFILRFGVKRKPELVEKTKTKNSTVHRILY
ncbi:splicing factor 3B subunit 2 [Trichonephila clavipes]|nr:splicing factor 3B subunit 2 [Trichonephila clavipes]